MHPNISFQLALARIADLRHQAQRDTLAHAARRGRPADGSSLPKSPPPHMTRYDLTSGGPAQLRTGDPAWCAALPDGSTLLSLASPTRPSYAATGSSWTSQPTLAARTPRRLRSSCSSRRWPPASPFYTGRCLTRYEYSRDGLTVSAGFALAADGTPKVSEVRLVIAVSPSLQPRRHRAVPSKREV